MLISIILCLFIVAAAVVMITGPAVAFWSLFACVVSLAVGMYLYLYTRDLHQKTMAELAELKKQLKKAVKNV